MSVERHDIHEQDSVGAYLLGALDEAELQTFEAAPRTSAPCAGTRSSGCGRPPTRCRAR